MAEFRSWAKPFGSMRRTICDTQDTRLSSRDRRKGDRMRTQGIRLSSSGRNALKNIIRLIPAVVLMAAVLNTVSCGNNNGLLPQDNGNGSNTPTATPTGGTGALAFVTNFNDGKVSSFTRNTMTGVLKRTGQVTAGAKKGPKGVVAAPSGSFLYVANNSDDNIYEFSVNQTNGTLTPLSPASVSNGTGSGPDEIAINPAGSFLWVTGAKKGTVTTYSINTSTGSAHAGHHQGDGTHETIRNRGRFKWLICLRGGQRRGIGLFVLDRIQRRSQPDRIASLRSRIGWRHPRLHRDRSSRNFYIRYRSQCGSTVGNSNHIWCSCCSVRRYRQRRRATCRSESGMPPSARAISFTLRIRAQLVDVVVPAYSPRLSVLPVAFGTGNLSAPTGLVVDPQNAFLYTTNQNAGTVSQFSLNPTCSAAPPVLRVSSATSRPRTRPSANSGPFGMTLAQ